jgi:hypothetical protein
MARTTEDKKALQIVMPLEAYNVIKDYAEELSTKQKTVFVSDVVREALQEYFAQRGQAPSFDVERGGYRGKKKVIRKPKKPTSSAS